MINFSVILPVYNGSEFLSEAIDSVLNQTYYNFELIIVDDNSNDDSAQIIKNYDDERIKYFKNKKNKERSFSRNLGISKSNYNWITFIDYDDKFEPNRLDCLKNEIKKNINNLFFVNCYKLIDDNSNIIGKKDLPKSEFLRLSDLLKKNHISLQSVLINKSLLLDNKFDELVNSSEDYKLWLNLTLKNSPLIINKYLTLVRKDKKHELKYYYVRCFSHLKVKLSFLKEHSIKINPVYFLYDFVRIMLPPRLMIFLRFLFSK